MEEVKKIIQRYDRNRQRRQPVSSSALREEEEWGLVRLQKEITKLQNSFQQLQEEVYDMKLTRDEQLSALSKEVAELAQNHTQEQQSSKEFREHIDSMSSKFDNMQLQLDSRLADMTEYVKAQSQDSAVANSAESGCVGLGDAQLVPAQSNDSEEQPRVLSRADWKKELQSIHDSEEYVFQESLWDTVVFLGTPALGKRGFILLAICLLANFAAQTLFLSVFCLVPNSFLSNMPPRVEDLEKWRASDAHDEKFSSNVHSLDRRVCDGDASLSFAAVQFDLVSQIEDYLANLGFEWIPLGGALTSVLLGFWSLLLFQEMRNIIDYLSAFCILPRGNTILTAKERTVTITSLHHARFFMVLVMTLVRVCICCTLLLVGSLWLGSTWNIEDLVLNTAALEFVLGVDDLLYKTVAPAEITTIMESLNSLPLPKCRAPHSFIGVVLTAVLVTAMGVTKVSSNIVQLQALNETICGGRQDFVFMKQASTGYLKWAHHPEREESWLHGAKNERFDAGEFYSGLVGTVINENVKPFMEGLPTKRDLFNVGQLTPGQMVTFSECVDTVATMPEKDIGYFKAMTGNVRSCDHLAHLCGMPGWSSVNSVCPATCGCWTPYSGLLVYEGCPLACYKSQFWGDAQCEDLTAHAIMSDDSLLGGWMTWWGRFQILTILSQLNTSSANLTAVFYGGCFEVNKYRRELCDTGDFAGMYGSLHFWCPVACGCKEVTQFCPSSCTSSGITR